MTKLWCVTAYCQVLLSFVNRVKYRVIAVSGFLDQACHCQYTKFQCANMKQTVIFTSPWLVLHFAKYVFGMVRISWKMKHMWGPNGEHRLHFSSNGSKDLCKCPHK